jgi:hypothetical protein
MWPYTEEELDFINGKKGKSASALFLLDTYQFMCYIE